jgi:hypothetical protein
VAALRLAHWECRQCPLYLRSAATRRFRRPSEDIMAKKPASRIDLKSNTKIAMIGLRKRRVAAERRYSGHWRHSQCASRRAATE